MQSLLRIHVLASGSKGNAAIIEDTQSHRALVVDCGICKRDFFDRCSELGIQPDAIEAFVITHEHSDHTKGLGVVSRGLAAKGFSPVLYAGQKTARASKEITALQNSLNIQSIKNEDSLTIAGIKVQVFATSHDAAESFGFRFEANGDAIGYATDTGYISTEAFEALQDCRVLALESNHDTRMLETGPYPYVLKQRVASDKGHLSNAQAAEALEKLLNNKLEQVLAMHISENNNTYPLPRKVLEEVLARNEHPAHVRAAFQHKVVSSEL